MHLIKIFLVILCFAISPQLFGREMLSAQRALPTSAFSATLEPQQLTLLPSGMSSLYKRLELIESAQKTIDCEFFLIESGRVGRLYLQALIAKAEQGVRVRLLIDFRRGNTNINFQDAEILRKHKIYTKFYNKEIMAHFKKANHRNHRKTLIVDGQTAVMGGRNMGDDYFDMSESYNMLDQDIAIQGSIVKSIAESFESFWNSGLALVPPVVAVPSLVQYNYESDADAYAHYLEGGRAALKSVAQDQALYSKNQKNAETLPVANEADQQLLLKVKYFGTRHLALAPKGECRENYFISDLPGADADSRVVYSQVQNFIAQAKNKVQIESPFFIPPQKENIFTQVIKRGVHVDILTNSLHSADVELTIAPFLKAAQNLGERGAQISVYKGGAPLWLDYVRQNPKQVRWGTHAKTFIIDDDSFLIGSFNMDPRSIHRNSEMAYICRGNFELTAEMRKENLRRKSLAVLLSPNAEPVDGRTNFFGVSSHDKLKYYISKPFTFLFESLL